MSTSNAAVLVVGDCMLDRYWDGRVARISPEAPVPVLHMRNEVNRLGGAANVAVNARRLGAKVGLLGVVGEDQPGRVFLEMLGSESIEQNVIIELSVTTTVKLRVVNQKHQLLRVDFEEPLVPEVSNRVARHFREAAGNSNCIVFSDYAKGALREVQDMIRSAKAAAKMVIVDPKGGDFRKYEGADIITPNQSELAVVVGTWADEDDLSRKAFTLRRALSIGSVLVTRSERGMSLFTLHDGDERRFDYPAEAREVFDVTGAGDTVVATLAVMLSEERPLTEATRLANRAAGLVVGRFGTASVSRDELFHALPPERR
jgi:rfaE bifunctional protein kinase chain/domain